MPLQTGLYYSLSEPSLYYSCSWQTHSSLPLLAHKVGLLHILVGTILCTPLAMGLLASHFIFSIQHGVFLLLPLVQNY